MPRLPAYRPPTLAGVVLVGEFLIPLGLTQVETARAIGVSFQRLNAVVRGRREVPPSTALRLARCLGATPEFWLSLQRNCDLYAALQAEGDEIERIEPVSA